MKIRKARIEDAKGIIGTHYDAIYNTAKTDYDKTILKAWHNGVNQSNIEKVRNII